MASSRFAGLDLVELAEDVTAGRRSLDNVIDQIAVAIPDDRKRRQAVAELQSLVVALAGVRAHAEATGRVGAGSGAGAPAAGAAASGSAADAGPERPGELIVTPRRIVARRSAFRRGGTVATAAVGLAAVILVSVVVASLRPAPSVGGPSPSLPGTSVAAVASPTPGASTQPSIGPSPTPAASSAPAAPLFGDRVVFWTHTESSVTVWTWQPLSGSGLEKLFSIDTYDIPSGPSYGVVVLASPDGTRFAVSEHAFGDPASHDRVRVLDASGRVLWTSPVDLPRTVDMAWSNDSVQLALGAVRSAVTVLTFRGDGSAKSTTYPLTDEATYGLLAFSSDGRQLIGDDEQAGVAFWQQPAALDMASGRITLIEAFPPELAQSSSNPNVFLVDPRTGAALVPSSTGSTWSVSHNSGLAPVTIPAGEGVAWAGGGTLVRVASAPASDGTWALSRELLTQLGHSVAPPIGLADRDHFPGLVDVHDGVALALTQPYPFVTYPVDPGADDALAVDLATGTVAQARPTTNATTFDGLWFGGWIAPPAEPIPGPSATPTPPATAVVPATEGPAPQAPAPTQSPVADTLPPADLDASPAIPGAPDIALWSDGAAPATIAVWRWSPSRGVGVRPWFTVDTWPTGTFTVKVVASPDGHRIAVTEYGGPSSNLNRVRVFTDTGAVAWSPHNPLTAVNLAWSPDSTMLAVEAVPGPWWVERFAADGSTNGVAYDMTGAPVAARMIGFSRDGSQLIGYASDGEAGFADRPVALDLTTTSTVLTSLAAFPPGMASNATTSRFLDRINDMTGDALVIANAATTPEWVLRHGGSDAPLGIGGTPDVAWADDHTIALEDGASPPILPACGASPQPTIFQGYRGISRMTGPGADVVEMIAYPGTFPGEAPAGLVAARDGNVLVYRGPGLSCTNSPDTRDARLLVSNVHSQITVNAVLPAGTPRDTLLLFAGWIPAN